MKDQMNFLHDFNTDDTEKHSENPQNVSKTDTDHLPLAARLRPLSLEQFFGQTKILKISKYCLEAITPLNS